MAIIFSLCQPTCRHVVSVALLLLIVCEVVDNNNNNVLAFSFGSQNRHHPWLSSSSSSSPSSSSSSSSSSPPLSNCQPPRPPVSPVLKATLPATVTTAYPIMELDPCQVLNPATRNQIQSLVNARAAARWEGDYDQADDIKQDIFRLVVHLLPPHVQLVLQDVPRSQGGGTTWNLIWTALSDDAQQHDDDEITQTKSSSSSSSSCNNNNNNNNVLHLAHAALGLAVSCSENVVVPLSEKQARLQTIVDQAIDSLQAWCQFQEILNTAGRSSSIIINNPSSTTGSSKDDDDDNDAKKKRLLQQQQRACWIQVETTLRGRKAADAAFWFALAGVTDVKLFRLLMNVCTKELHRFGHKPSCRAKDIYQMMHRFAAAGVLRSESDDHDDDDADNAAAAALESNARKCLKIKWMEQEEPHADDISKKKNADDDDDSLLDLHSDQTLLMLWKFSARQKKQQSFLQSAQKHWEKSSQIITTTTTTVSAHRSGGHSPGTYAGNYDGSSACWMWNERFEDPTKPLILDIGCGMGISLLGLASLFNTSSTNSIDKGQHESSLFAAKELGDCNLMGVDLSGLAIEYAQGIAKRWGLSHRLQYEVDAAETLLARVRNSYPGPVSLCMIQFPTPYRLVPSNKASDDEGLISTGNSQLPNSAFEGFMVSPKLLQLVREILLNKNKRGGGQCGKLLLQSNCEDVAMWMQQTATKEGYQSLIMPSPVETVNNDVDNLPQRTRNWIAMGGESRAVGQYWSTVPLLPAKGSTETEVACRINQTPIHRCILQPSD